MPSTLLVLSSIATIISSATLLVRYLAPVLVARQKRLTCREQVAVLAVVAEQCPTAVAATYAAIWSGLDPYPDEPPVPPAPPSVISLPKHSSEVSPQGESRHLRSQDIGLCFRPRGH